MTLLLTVLGMASAASAAGHDMPKTFQVRMDAQVFSITTPAPPEKEFARHRPLISLGDDKPFESASGVTGLKVHWKYYAGPFRKVAGIVEAQVVVRAARDNDVASEEGLRQQLQAYFKRELAKVGYTGAPIPLERETINRRTWLKYQVPVLGTLEYAIGISDTRYLTVQFAFIDNTGEKTPEWYRDASELVKQIVSTMRLESL